MTSSTASLASSTKSAIFCSTCVSKNQDSRTLSCMHSCCLQCLEHTLASSLPRDSAGCVMCGKAKFIVPSNTDVASDTTDYSVAQNDNIDCHGTAERTNDFDASDSPNIIDIPHKKLKLMSLVRQKTSEQDLPVHRMNTALKLQSSGPAEPDCEVEVHCNSSDFSDSQVLASENRHQAQTGIIESLIVGTNCCRNMLKMVDSKRSDVICSTLSTEIEIFNAAEHLKNLVEQHKVQALASLATAKHNQMQQLDSLHSVVKLRLSLLEKSIHKAASEGTVGDATLEMAAVNSEADELLKLNEMKSTVEDICSLNISFLVSDAMSSQCCNVIGKISDASDYHKDSLTSPSLKHVVPRGSAVIGVTLLGEQLFVLRWPSQQQIEVYDAETFIFCRPLSVPGLSGRPGGLTSCLTNNCLYVSDFQTSTLYRVGLTENRKPTLMKWPVDKQPTGVSVTAARNVLVICRGCPHKIQEYTSHGLLVREIRLPSDVTRPMHAVQLNTGQFLIANGGTLPGQFGFRPDELHRISLLGADGSLVNSYGSTFGSGVGQLDEPMQLAVSEASGFILATVKENHQVIVLNPTLTLARNLPLSVPGGGLKGPISLCFSESRGRLFIGEGIGGRLFVFDDVTNVRNY